jgi:hypothetical protein
MPTSTQSPTRRPRVRQSAVGRGKLPEAVVPKPIGNAPSGQQRPAPPSLTLTDMLAKNCSAAQRTELVARALVLLTASEGEVRHLAAQVEEVERTQKAHERILDACIAHLLQATPGAAPAHATASEVLDFLASEGGAAGAVCNRFQSLRTGRLQVFNAHHDATLRHGVCKLLFFHALLVCVDWGAQNCAGPSAQTSPTTREGRGGVCVVAASSEERGR